MDYRFPELPGIAERWGRSVFHCPFCHGWEHRDELLGVLDRGARGAQRALLLRVWSHDVTLFTDGAAELEPTDGQQLAKRAWRSTSARAAGCSSPSRCISAPSSPSGSTRPSPTLATSSDAVKVDSTFLTTVPGLYAAGDVSTQMPSVAGAIAAGHSAAAMIVGGLLAEARDLARAGAGAENPR